TRTSYNGINNVATRTVDVSTPALRHALSALAATGEGAVYETEENYHPMLFKVNPPVHVRVVPPQALLAAAESTKAETSSADYLETFMTNWSHLVGDPLMSKWIVVVLAISISLNGYLLKGIAAGLAGKGATKGSGVRFSGGAEEKEETPAPTPTAPTP
ncbi:hypothetical protein MPER_15912, partial [Moniliophthora perniciosa FA553]